MKIGLVRRGYSATGGAERYLLRFAAGLEARGHSCVLFSDVTWPEHDWGRREAILVEGGRSPMAFAESLDETAPLDHCDFLFSLERVWDCDCYRAGDGVHAAWLKRRREYESKWRPLFRWLNGKHAEILDLEADLYHPEGRAHIIANSNFVKKEIQEIYKTPEDRITVIPNGFDAPALTGAERRQLRQAGRETLQANDDTVLYLFAGSGWERKGLRFAVDAVESLAAGGHDARLIVAGKDRRRPPASTVGVTQFLGPVDAAALTQLYEAADVFILPTLYDPFSNASLEAAGHGLPIITTISNGICELWPDLEGSVVERPDDPQLIEACREWLDPERRAIARNRNRASAAVHSVERNVHQTLECFNRLIQQG